MSAKRFSVLEILLWIILLLFVLLALSPYIIGYRAKSDYVNLIQQISQLTQQNLQVSNYDQGFFSSQATLTLTLPQNSEAILFKEEIIHGPVYLGLIAEDKSPLIAAVINGELDMQASHIKTLKITSETSPLLYQHLIDFIGDVETQVYVPPIKALIHEGAESLHVESSGAMFTQRITSADNNLKVEMTVPLINIHKTDFDMNIENTVISYSGIKGANQLMIGDTVFSVASLDIEFTEEKFAVRQLVVHSATSEVGKLINSGWQISAREVLASNQKFGPIALNVSLNGLDADSLLQLEKMKTSLDKKLAEGVSAEAVNASIANQVMGIVPGLIKQAEININPLSINSELGRLEADMEFKLQGVDTLHSTDLLSLLNTIQFELNASIDEPLIKKLFAWQLNNLHVDPASSKTANTYSLGSYDSMSLKVDQNLKAILAENWLVKAENSYVSKISMHQGELLINNTPVDFLRQIMSFGNSDSKAPVH